MRRIAGLILCVIFSATSLFAQSRGTVKGTLVDANTKQPIIGAVIEVSDTRNPDVKKHFTTEANGAINIRSLDYGRYKVVFTYLGYKDLEKTVNVNKESVNVGTWLLEPGALDIEKVTLEVPALRTSQKGDTVVYNAAAFKVSADADTEGLLAKMPGITITDGTVEAQGETVRKVLVDGREFFGEDVATAIKNLPAEVVEKVEVYDRLSDQAEFTGFDDGQGYKTINIITAVDKRSGQFGKLYGAYGYPEYYIAGGNVNIFTGNHRISLIGLVNNLNQKNFSFEDIVGVTSSGGSSSGGGRMRGGWGGGSARNFMVRPEDGISTVQAFGLNYSSEIGDKFKITGSYFFNHTDTDNTRETQTWRYTDTEDMLYTGAVATTNSGNFNHRLNARIDYNINENHNIMIRPSLSLQSYKNRGTTISNTSNLLNDIFTPIRGSEKISDSNRAGIDGGANILYRVKLSKPGRTITLNFDGNASNNNYNNYPIEYYYLPEYTPSATPDNMNRQKILTNNLSYRLSGGLTYTEPVGERSQLSMEYRARYSYSEADKKTYLWDEVTEDFDPVFDGLLSSIFTSGYLTQSVGPGYRYSDKKFNVSVNGNYQHSLLVKDQQYPEDIYDRISFNNFVYSANATYNINSANSLRIRASSNTNNPSVTQLRTSVETSNRENVTSGNPDLVPSYNNRISLQYNNSNVSKGRTLSFSTFYSNTINHIGDYLIINRPAYVLPNGEALGAGNQYSRPVNLNGMWRLGGWLTYGFPLKFMKSNLNLELGATFGQMPSMINDARNDMDEQYYNAGLSLSSNISENLDFTIRYVGSYNTTTSIHTKKDPLTSITEATKQRNNFVNQYVSANVKWIFWQGLTLQGTCQYSQYRGITDDYNEEILLCNLYIGKKVFKSRRGEISIGVNDVFDQNRSFNRTVTSTQIQNVSNSAIGRYYAVQFIYNLRNFGKRASRNGGDYEGLDQSNGSVGIQRPGGGGRPPGGGPGGPGGFGRPH